MFRTRVLLQAAARKSTGLVGLPVVPDARERLIGCYKETLVKVQDGYHPESPYRKSVESITNFRLAVVEKNEDTETIEKEIDCGLIEELLEQAKTELELIEELRSTPFALPVEEKA